MVKGFMIGVALGVAVSAPISYNYGRGAPLFSNPFQQRTIVKAIKENAQQLADDAKDAIKEVGKEVRK